MPLPPLQRDLFCRRTPGPAPRTFRQIPAPGVAWRRALQRRPGTFAVVMAVSLSVGVVFLVCRRPTYQAEASVEAAQVTPQRNLPMLPSAAGTTAQELGARAVVAAATKGMGAQAQPL
ncbi:MAG: hypothetical protein ACRD0Y_08905, partial [Terriglobales bacterium]